MENGVGSLGKKMLGGPFVQNGKEKGIPGKGFGVNIISASS